MTTQINPELQTFLLNGEMILWNGKPATGIKFQAFDIFFIPFGILWCWFVYFLNTFLSFPFAIYGFYILIGRFLHDILIRKSETYYVTNIRTIIKQGQNITSFPLSLQKHISILGNHSVCFEPLSMLGNFQLYKNNFGVFVPSVMKNSFQYIKDAQIVYNQILEAQKALKS